MYYIQIPGIPGKYTYPVFTKLKIVRRITNIGEINNRIQKLFSAGSVHEKILVDRIITLIIFETP